MITKRNKFYLSGLIYFFVSGFMVHAQQAPEAIIQYLSGKDRKTEVEWDFYCSDGRNSGEWTKIKVPSNWELENFGTYNYGHDHKNQSIKYGKEYGLYKHEFDVPEKWEGKQINIVFEGSMTDTEVRINSQLAGEIHQGAFYRFKYDISGLLKYGDDNLLEVKVSKSSSNESVNEAERYADYWIFGGIFRPVYLEVLPQSNFERVAIDASAPGGVKINAFLNEKSSSNSIELTLTDQSGQSVDQTRSFDLSDSELHHTITTTYDDIQTWNPESPHLYTMQVDLLKNNEKIFSQKEKIGFRTVELIPNDGIYVNGEKIILKGVARHSFHPKSGRCLSDEDHLTDVNLIKDMNMNVVRMSHYPPDVRFLEICDSLGLFVLDELGGWQDGYDTIVGPKLIRELIVRDENHPSVIIWDFGNEGGWEFPNEKWFDFYDFQKRPVIFPWLRRNNTDTRHYPSWSTVNTRLVGDDQIFFPTELLHGLYDGGHGANLNDYWEAFKQRPQNAAGIMWNLKDEAVWRTDSLKYDSDGNHAPDGIVGPNNEKEGSFYSIKEIWSPVQIDPFVVNSHYDGELVLRNEYIYTNLKDCTFSWRLIEKGTPGHLMDKTVASGDILSPDAAPGVSSKISIPLADNFTEAEVLEFEAIDPSGREIYTWRWPVKRAEVYIPELVSEIKYVDQEISTNVTQNKLEVQTGNLSYTFDLDNGKLLTVKNSKGRVSFSGGPTPVGYEGEPNKIREVTWEKRKDGNVIVHGSYDMYPESFEWIVRKNGLLEMSADPLKHTKEGVQTMGLSFNYPESKMTGFRWMGNGPYRVYKNRLKGTTFNVWDKKYNNTITGQSFDSLIYPEFKGYHSNLYWAAFDTEESDFKVYCQSPDIYLKMYNPPAPDDPRHAHAYYPEGDISFLNYIPGIGTKFQSLDELGPSAQPDRISRRTGDVFKPLKLVFDFHAGEDLDIGIQQQGAFERIAYHNPDLVVDLGVGLWAWPLPMDYNQDGKNELIVACPDKPYNGLYLFERSQSDPDVFQPSVRLGEGSRHLQVSFVDGKPRVLGPGVEYRNFRESLLSDPVELFPSDSLEKDFTKIRFKQWKYVDYDDDQDLDIVVGMDEWGEYGWDNAFNEEGEWTNGPLHGYLYLLENVDGQYSNRGRIKADGVVIDVYGAPTPNLDDFDDDGDLDIICGEFLDRLTYFENIGTRAKPVYEKGEFLKNESGIIHMDLEMIIPVSIDWDKDGDMDLVVGDEDGRVALIDNTGEVEGGMPVFTSPTYMKQQADKVKFGALVTPYSTDWDNDGDEDLICGNTAGYIGFIENLDGATQPKWAAPVRLAAAGETIRIQAGYNGSIQGPAEAKWGYTTVSVTDWNGDGLKDILANSIWGKVVWYENVGTSSEPVLKEAQPIKVDWENGNIPKPSWNWWEPEGNALSTQWRTIPQTIDWNKDGLMDLVMLDHEGYLSFFERFDDEGILRLKPGERIFYSVNDAEFGDKNEELDGTAGLIRNSNLYGGSGRRKWCFVDWDQDGDMDIIVNSTNAALYENIGEKNGLYQFENKGDFTDQQLAGHTTSPTVVDWNKDGWPDLLLGAEDGFLYYLANPNSK